MRFLDLTVILLFLNFDLCNIRLQTFLSIILAVP